jgi:HrpA-like RNA helicase
MALFPLEPALSRMLLSAIVHKCSDDMLTLVAMVGGEGDNVFYRPTMKEEQASADVC